ncbi:hypothetical protein OPQ81_006253 [Rhizoctonia solani]|nr:hypothetical protein OPQ81_006253 [Rhizoctonia solani]
MARSKRKSAKSQHTPHKNGSKVAEKITVPRATGPNSKKRNRKKQSKQLVQSKQPEQANTLQPRAYLKIFFEKYPLFDYDSSKPVMSEFYRMCDQFGWERDDEERDEARDDLKEALVQEFNTIYGTDQESIVAWQSLCRVLNLSNVPDQLEPCRQLVKSMHVNIVDLVDTPATRQPVTHFASEEALSIYTRSTGKYFPKESAYAGGLLRYLLRHIDNPRAASSRR